MTLVADVVAGAKRTLDVWEQPIVGAAYSLQPLAPPYQEMESVVRGLIGVTSGHWLDIGCGSGRTTQVILEAGAGHVTAMDISRSALAYAERRLRSAGQQSRVSFETGNVSEALRYPDESFDGVFAGLVMQYAESKSADGAWTLDGYCRALAEAKRVLKPNAPFVWTVNVPDPDFSLIVKRSWRQIFLTWRVFGRIPVALFLRWQSNHLKEEATKGRFHYLPIEQVRELAMGAGFTAFRSTLTYAGQAWAIHCR